VAEPGDHADLSSAMRLLHGFDPMIREAMGDSGRSTTWTRCRLGSAARRCRAW
jgi:hypothetical protein